MADKSISLFARKGAIVINLITTPDGYCIEGNQAPNKSSTTNITTLPTSLPPTTKQKANHLAQPTKKQSIIIPMFPYVSNKHIEKKQHHIILPSCAAWFNFDTVHEIEKRALPEWFNIKKVGTVGVPPATAATAVKSERFEKCEELYIKYRNYIVDLGNNEYVTATRARKGLAGDACSIMRIHAFLEHWGIINRYDEEGETPNLNPARELIMKFDEEEHKQDMFDYDKKLLAKSYNQEDGDLLKNSTKKYRPLCDFCTQRCGIVWFEHKRVMNSKEIAQIMKTVNPKNPALSTTEYEISLCLKCYSEGNFPIIFTSSDFNKITVQEKIEEINKSKKKRDKEVNEASNDNENNEWSLADTDKVLSLLLKNGDDWQATADEFPGRTAEDILLCFLTLPMKNVSKIKFQSDITEFIKQNTTELENNPSDNICASALEQMSVANRMQVEIPKSVEIPVSKEQYGLFEEIVRLELKRASLKLSELEDWEKYLETEKRHIEEGRKNVIAEKLRLWAKQL